MSERQIIDLSGGGWRLWLDTEAAWEHDVLHLPPVELADLPVRPPSGGWEALGDVGRDVTIPTTVETHTWDELGDYRGVSWWARSLSIPESAAGRRVLLQFDAVRLRAEVFLDEQLVGYDLIGNTPFEVDLTDYATPGATHRLAVRITDPGGNFSWEDYDADRWGHYTLPASHGFGGITGDVRLLIFDPVNVEDIFVQNKPTPTDIALQISLRNATAEPATRDVHVEIVSWADPAEVLHAQTLHQVAIAPGEHPLALELSLPAARLWQLDAPHLYVCRVSLDSGDACEVRFGFRWFEVVHADGRALFRLNGRRIVLRTAISWSFWPITGMVPTPALAERQVRVAKALGLNMLSFHRTIGIPEILDRADEMGLLYYEEPGGYTAHGGDELCFSWAREKLLRMVMRDRNHPSLVIYNMINEEESDPAERHVMDMRAVHRLDPTRCITFTSGWNSAGDDPKKLHMLPYDKRQRTFGWTDFHHAPGPGVYRDQFYNGPSDYRLHTDNAAEIVFWGEEGAIGTPPRLEKIIEELKSHPNGWDGADYRAWYQAYADFLDRKDLRGSFASVDALCQTLGNVAFYYQGRMIENVRLGNLTDAYAVNGWESQKWENHSGIVDGFRHPKGDRKVLAYYNQPLYVAVKARSKVAHVGTRIVADLHLINELDIHGPHTLTVWLEDGDRQQHWLQDFPVTVTGGETFGELLVEHVQIDPGRARGRCLLRAELRDDHAKVITQGYDELLFVDWQTTPLASDGAILETDDTVHAFLQKQKDMLLPGYAPSAPPLSYLVVGDHNPVPREPVPAHALQVAAGKPGLRAEYFLGVDLTTSLSTRIEPMPHVAATGDGATAPFVPGTDTAAKDFSVRWTGELVPPDTGDYRFHVESDDGVRLWVNGELILDEWTDYAWWHGKRPKLLHAAPVYLAAGEPVSIKIEFFQVGGQGVFELMWTTPTMQTQADVITDDLVRRVHEDGTSLVILDHTYHWGEVLADREVVDYRGVMHGKVNWLGSNTFVTDHPILAGLPINQAMNWPYQEFVEYGARRQGLLLEGEQVVAGLVSDHQHQISTAVGIVPHGRGQVILSTLDILPRLNETRSACDVVRKLFCNMLAFAGKPRR